MTDPCSTPASVDPAERDLVTENLLEELSVNGMCGAHWRGLGSTLGTILVAMLIGAVIGAWQARTIRMTGMPERVAVLHSFVGLVAVLVCINSFLDPEAPAKGALARSTRSRSSPASSSAP